MAFQKYGQHDQSFICDELADLAKLPKANMGSTCYVIATAEKYMINSKGEWILQTVKSSSGGSGSGGSGEGEGSDGPVIPDDDLIYEGGDV